MGRTPQETLEIERRRQLVAELYLKSVTQATIARELGVAQSTISADLKAIRRQWRDSQIRDFEEAVTIELKKIDRLEREAWAAWERSQEPAETTRVTSDGNGKRAQKTTRQQQGDPRFLEQLHRCIAARRAILGLDAPTRIAPTSPDGEEAYHTHVMHMLLQLAEGAKDGPEIIDAAYIEQQIHKAGTAEKGLPAPNSSLTEEPNSDEGELPA